MKTPNARPYGIKIDADGVPWVACNGSNCLVKVDPITMDLTEVKLPTPETTVRRLDIAQDGIIWYVNSSQGRLGRYDPKTGEIKEWPSPSGPRSHPYAIAVVDGARLVQRVQACGPTCSCASTPARSVSRVGRSRREAFTRASSATCGQPVTATS